MFYVRIALSSLLIAALAPALFTTAPSSAAAASVAEPAAPTVGFGRIGKARAGMGVARAMGTGQFNRHVFYEVPGVCSRVFPLEPKRPWKNSYDVMVRRHRIQEMVVFDRNIRTEAGVGRGTTARKVANTYDVTRPIEVGYGQWALMAHNGRAGAERRWIAFVFGMAYTYERQLRADDKVTWMSVSTGKRPSGWTVDGC